MSSRRARTCHDCSLAPSLRGQTSIEFVPHPYAAFSLSSPLKSPLHLRPRSCVRGESQAFRLRASSRACIMDNIEEIMIDWEHNTSWRLLQGLAHAPTKSERSVVERSTGWNDLPASRSPFRFNLTPDLRCVMHHTALGFVSYYSAGINLHC